MKAHNDSMAVRRSYGRIELRNSGSGNWHDGIVGTKHGFVAVYGEVGGDNPLTRFDFIWKGRLYMRTMRREYTKRGLVRLATQMAEDVVASK